MQKPGMESKEIRIPLLKKEAELRERPCAWGLGNPGPGGARDYTSAGPTIGSWRTRRRYSNGNITRNGGGTTKSS